MGSNPSISGGIVGGFTGSLWGFPGMMIGAALGAWIFAKFAKKHKPYNPETADINTITRIDNVPYLIGTDMCPGQLVWFGQLGLLDSADLRSQDIFDSGSSYFSSYYKPFASKFAVVFCQSYNVGSSGNNASWHSHYINRLFFEGRDIWNWGLWLGEAVKWDMKSKAYDLGVGYNPIKIIKPTWYISSNFDYLLKIPEPDVPHKSFTWFSYDGWFGDFTIAEQLGSEVTTDNDINFGAAIRLKKFPDITGEVSSYFTAFTGEALREGTNLPNNNISGVRRYGCRDGLHDYYYIFYSGVNFFQFVRIHPMFGGTVLGSDPTVIQGNTLPDIHTFTHGWTNNMNLSRTDEWDNRLYFFNGRVLNGDLSYKHHVPYSLKYDLFYIDRNDTLNPVSLKLDETITGLNHFDTGNSCAFHAQSMEITKNGKILVFGRLNQDAFPIYDYLPLTQTSTGTRLYLNLSGYPNGYWVNKYAWVNIDNFESTCPRKIIAQTQTYIDLESSTGIESLESGLTVALSYAKTWDQDYVTADVGSTTTMLICNCPISSMKVNNDGKFEAVRPQRSNYVTRYTIDYGRTNFGGNIYLLDPLPTTPVPGQRYWIGAEGSATWDEDIANPNIPFPYYLDTNNGENYRLGQIYGNGDGPNIVAVLQFDKETGEFEGIVHKTLMRSYLAGNSWLIYTSGWDDLIITVATENEIYVHYAIMNYPSSGQICEWYIDQNTLAFTKVFSGGTDWGQGWESNPFSSGHAWGTVFVAAAWLWKKNEETGEYFKQWYALLHDYKTYTIMFLMLSNGRFLSEDSICLLKRPVMYSGPLVAGWWFNGTSMVEDAHLGKCGIENRLYIYLNHSWDGGYYSFGGLAEVYIFDSPTVENPKGSFRLVSTMYENWNYCNTNMSSGGGIREWWITSTFTTMFFQYYNIAACSYHCDENPINAILNLLKSSSLAQYSGGQGYAYTQINFDNTNINNSVALCQAAVSAEVAVGNDLITFQEPRFQYSMCYDSSKAVGDIVKEIMQSCMGWVHPCGKKLLFTIPNQNETPVFHFGLEATGHQFSVTMDIPNYPQSAQYVEYVYYGSPQNSIKIPLDLSNYSLGYFTGEDGSFTFQGYTYRFIVIEHSRNDQFKVGFIDNTTEVDQFVSNAYWYGVAQFANTVVNVNPKDNIKKGSFVFQQKSRLKRPNLVRVEYKDRLGGYITNIAESQSDYLRQNDGYDKIQTYNMLGIKRGTQAGRIAQRMMDYCEFVEWTCGLETDVAGLYLCPGNIVSVTHPITGWIAKWFRIMSMEETGEDFNVKFELEEYNPYVYHDKGTPLILNIPYGGMTPTDDWKQMPLALSNVAMFEDKEFPYLYVGFTSQTVQGNLIGARVYRLVGSDYVPVGNVSGVPATMFLNVALTDSIFDNAFLDYRGLVGTLPSSGLIWIGSELIYYNGIDAANHRLMNLVRGYGDTVISTHNAGTMITLIDNNFIEIDPSWVGSQTFKVIPINYGNPVVADISTAPSVTITIVGYGLKPYFPESLRLMEQ